MATLATRRWEAAGPRAVLVHGVTAWSNTWWRIGPGLAERGWDVLAVDLRGHGDSPSGRDGLTLDDLGGDLIETVGPGPLDLLIGHSLGALSILAAVRGSPQLARRVVLEEPPGIASVDRPLLAALIEDDLRRAQVDREGFIAGLLEQNPRWHTRDAIEAAEGVLRCDGAAVVRAVAGLELDWDLVELAGALHVPSLVILASDVGVKLGSDAGGSALNGRDRTRFLAALDGARAVVIDGGHSIYRSEPERWLDEVTAFAKSASR
jgi:pimeloyl-ACP methyl ester carboxylesterase